MLTTESMRTTGSHRATLARTPGVASIARTAEDRTLVDAAARTVRDAILSGELEPGSALLLRELAERLSISIMPVREAIARLAAEGLVAQVSHRGARVASVSLDDLEDLYRLRVVVETAAMREAARHLTPESAARLRAVLAAHEDRSGDGERSRRELHREFHLGVYALAGSPRFMRTIIPLWDATERYRRLAIRRRGTPEDRWHEHAAMLRLMERGDGEAAATALERHLTKTLVMLKRELFDATTSTRRERDGAGS